MHNKNKLWNFSIIILILVLMVPSVIAQVAGKIYVLTLNYKSAVLVNSLTLVDLRESTGTPQQFPDKGDYKLEIVSSDGKVLKTIYFNIQILNPQAQQSDINLFFTMGIPYFSNAKLVKIYDKGNNQLLETALKSDVSARKITSPESTSPNFFWVYVGLPIILIIVFLVYVEINRKKSHTELMDQLKKQNSLTLRTYVMTNVRKGYSKEQIRNALIKNNYSSKEIEEAFKGLK